MTITWGQIHTHEIKFSINKNGKMYLKNSIKKLRGIYILKKITLII